MSRVTHITALTSCGNSCNLKKMDNETDYALIILKIRHFYLNIG